MSIDSFLGQSFVAAVMVLVAAWIFGKGLLADGKKKKAFKAIGIWLLLSTLTAKPIFLGIIFFMLGSLLFVWMFIGTRSGAASYSALVKLGLNNGDSLQEAINRGLKGVTHREPFNQLNQDDIEFLSKVFTKIENPQPLGALIVESDKRGDIQLLKDRNHVVEFAKFVQSRNQEG